MALMVEHGQTTPTVPGSEEMTLLVSFLRSDSETSSEALEERLASVNEFFERNPENLKILHYELQKPIRVHRSGGRGARMKDHGEGLLYEAPFAEAKYSIRVESRYNQKGERKSPYSYVYQNWCEDPPALDAWLSRGTDQHLIDGLNQTVLKDTVQLADLSFGVVMNLTEFVPESVIPCAATPPESGPYMTAEASFSHAYKNLKIYLVMYHTCEVYNGAPSGYMLEISYASIARAIVDMKKDKTYLYLRLTHPFILYGTSSAPTTSKDGKLKDFKDYDRINVLTRPSSSKGCCKKVGSRLLGGCNTIKLGWKNPDPRQKKGVGALMRIHSFLARLQRGESVIASMKTREIPVEFKEQTNEIVKNFFEDESVLFRAKYAVEACKLISLDFYRQLNVLTREQAQEFFRSLKEKAQHEGTHKLLEKTMFNLLKAVDDGNVVMYKEAIPSQFRTFESQERQRRARTIAEGDEEKPVQGMAIVYKVFLTPSRTILRPPEEHGENRILRQVNRDYMLRLAFRDDHLRSLTHSLKGLRGETFLKNTIKKFLQDGIFLANRAYEYLAASSSQLRDHGCWFYAEDDEGRTSASIRSEMGSFDNIKNVGKKMAREGLCFSSTIETVTVPQDQCFRERDIKGGQHEVSGKPYTFSDGIGKISSELRDDVCEALAETLKADAKPSAFQIRYQGAKGMVAFDPSLKGRCLVLRDSMVKFDCPSNEGASFEVIKFSEERSTTLNKQIITILEQLGVDPEVFIRYQETNIIDFADALIFENVASDRLTASIKKDPDCVIEFNKFRDFGMSIIKDPFFRSMLIVLYKNIITNLRQKARISIPWDLGRNLLGVIDETGTLEYGQVYIQYTVKEDPSGPDRNPSGDGDGDGDGYGDDDEEDNTPLTQVVKGPVVVTKCPCVHPGDVRMLEAVDVPELAHMVDVIVFPQKGPRPHPDEMAGSDLDGDEYAALWDPSFFFVCKCPECKRIPRTEQCPPHERNHKPMVFDDSPAEEKDDITLSDYYDFICQFIMTDNKGNVSNAHLAQADQTPDGIFSPVCLGLAKKVSICLDFAKTGRGTELGPDERPKRYPDFMEKQDHLPSYCSQRVLGKMYRTCRTLENTASMAPLECDESYFNESFRVDGWETMRDKAFIFVKKYEQRLTKIMENMNIKSEAEIMVSVVHQLGKYASNSFHEVEELQEQLERQRSYLNKKMKEDFYRLAGDDPDNQMKLASACYMLVYNPPLGEKYTKFHGAPWILFKQLSDCRDVNDPDEPRIPNCPLATDLTTAINVNRGDDEDDDDDHTRAMMKIVEWAKAERLMDDKKEASTCTKCLVEIYKESLKFAHKLDIEFNVGAYVLLFIRYCALDFSRKVRCLEFSTCEENCAMQRKEEAMLHRMTTTAIGTYSALAVSGDICAIRGFKCGKEHGRTVTWSAKLCWPLVLDVRFSKCIDFLHDNQKTIPKILKKWCDAEPDDHIELDFPESKKSVRVTVIVVAQEWVRHRLEERLFNTEEKFLVEELRDELKKMGLYKETNVRAAQNMRR